MWTTYEPMEADYTEYLGAGYLLDMSSKTTSTIVGNHVSWLDTIVIAIRMMPALAPKASMKKTPFIKTMANSISSLWIPRV